MKFLGVYDYTVILTYVGLISSMIGMTQAIHGDYKAAVFCLAFSGVCDAFDGRIARTKKDRTHREKNFGIQLDSLCDVEYVYEMRGKSILGPWTGLRHLDIRLTDKGLMPIVALNVDQDPAVAQMSMDTLAQMLAANLPNGAAVLPALKTFIATPGELKIGIAGDDWIPVQPDNPLWLLQLVTRLQVESTPGKSPLADLVKAQLEKAGN